MSTRATIARATNLGGLIGWEGRYHHSDGYPEGLGAALFELWNGHFEKNTEAMMKFLLEDHQGGWSNIIGTDFNKPAGYGSPDGPRCYCHGERSEGPYEMNRFPERPSQVGGDDYLYVLGKDKMVIFKDVNDTWQELATVKLDGPEPEWDKLRSQATKTLTTLKPY